MAAAWLSLKCKLMEMNSGEVIHGIHHPDSCSLVITRVTELHNCVWFDCIFAEPLLQINETVLCRIHFRLHFHRVPVAHDLNFKCVNLWKYSQW